MFLVNIILLDSFLFEKFGLLRAGFVWLLILLVELCN